MTTLKRDSSRSEKLGHDLIIVGGGIYGAMMTLEAARRGLKPLLLERGDFGEATSWNSLSIVHGGLRYLQKLDLHRFLESVAERKWFLKHFPDLVEPIECLMPLYNKSVYRTWVFRMALIMNACLSWNRNKGVPIERFLGNGRIVTPAETRSFFPRINREGLKGAALWVDAVMPNSERVMIEILRWACESGAVVLNYMEGLELIQDDTQVKGVRARDTETGRLFDYRAPVVVNCAGPWCRQLAGTMDRDISKLFRPSISFNILLKRSPLSGKALAVKPDRTQGQVYFLRPWGNQMLAGTYYMPWEGGIDNPLPHEEDIETFLKDLNRAIPDWNLKRGDIVRIYAGLLPAVKEHSRKLTNREILVNHNKKGGPHGFFSISGVKFTTARLVTAKMLKLIYRKSQRDISYKPERIRPSANTYLKADEVKEGLQKGDEGISRRLRNFAEEEAVLHLDDLVCRRTDWLKHVEVVRPLLPDICRSLGWDSSRTDQEISRLERIL